jgi:hypothetical protein
MAEWSNAPDSKSGIRFYRIEGSNPSLSAKTSPANAIVGVSNYAEPRTTRGFLLWAVEEIYVNWVALTRATRDCVPFMSQILFQFFIKILVNTDLIEVDDQKLHGRVLKQRKNKMQAPARPPTRQQRPVASPRLVWFVVWFAPRRVLAQPHVPTPAKP